MDVPADKPKSNRGGYRPGGGRPRGSRAKITSDIREDILAAWHALGGYRFAIKLGKRDPKTFVALAARVIPAETKLSLLASYQAMPIPVEQRDAIAAPAAPQAIGHVVADVIEGAVEPAPADDWLDGAPD